MNTRWIETTRDNMAKIGAFLKNAWNKEPVIVTSIVIGLSALPLPFISPYTAYSGMINSAVPYSYPGFMFLTLLLSAMLNGRGRKVLTLWGGRECSSSDSGVRAGRPADTSLSSWPVLVLLALDKKRELEGRSQTERNKTKGNTS
ncbi:NADH dehydrogenase [ubiquinone] 1 alpha subcomplex subunit 3 [Liparis tanakae]|uniref:NADH dehydrogenase [ubiquinone] 1 alpha subcomplex subunit 3 n=1 Tax=Liparis tanakae TaxID=230148 RepID=A0A4Z2ISP0_9TELE|nr:NADH dehydrogenase [ubiquinone] 1 alpha subcomplex subunit 3 [Liparis tanakae]